MKPLNDFSNYGTVFWAHVKFISERCGYAKRGSNLLKKYTPKDVYSVLKKNNIIYDSKIYNNIEEYDEFVSDVLRYLNRRAEILNNEVQYLLMDKERARLEFENLKSMYHPKCNLPLNKQKGDMKHPAYQTCITNMLAELTLGGCKFDDNPRGLTIVTRDNALLKTFSRWMDGAYPQKINPIAVWEVKEYYNATTFGSRVADGVYESMLDGFELNELWREHGIKINHYLIIDGQETWWAKGKSYLCRIIDLLNMGYVDEVIFGKEILEEWPKIIKSWNLPSQ